MMYSIGRQVYRIEHVYYSTLRIGLCQPKIGSVIKKFELKNKYVCFKYYYNDCVFITDHVRYAIFFDGNCVDMKISKYVYAINFEYVDNRYIVFDSCGEILVYDYVDCCLKLVGYMNCNVNPFCKLKRNNYKKCHSIKQSPNKKNILLVGYFSYVIPTEIFINNVLVGFDEGSFEQYKIDLDINENWYWLDHSRIFTNILKSHGKNIHNYLKIFDIVSKYEIDIDLCTDQYSGFPFFINGLLMIILDNKILLVDNDNKIIEFPNYHKIICYNPALDLFMDIKCNVYIRRNVRNFVRFQFTGDYDRDYECIPDSIKTVMDCLLDCGFVYDVMNEIYRHLLKLDHVTNFVY